MFSTAATTAVNAFLGSAAVGQFTRDAVNLTVSYSGSPTDWTYRRMILHYANLCAVAGGVGPGKSTLMAMVADWALTTCVDARGRITANTGPQLSTTTWPELQKWRQLSVFGHWFRPLERSIRSVDPLHKESWRVDAMTWDENNPQAFAGFHNRGRRILLGFDESSTIPRPIWNAGENVQKQDISYATAAGQAVMAGLCLWRGFEDTEEKEVKV